MSLMRDVVRRPNRHDVRPRRNVPAAADRIRAQASSHASILRRAILGIDSLLRRAQGLVEFSASEDCLLRIAIIPARAAVRLSDGTAIERGDPIVAIHLWNEHLPPLPDDGPSFAWAKDMRIKLLKSMHELAASMEANPALDGIKGCQAGIALDNRGRNERVGRLGVRFGFERVASSRRPWIGRRIHRLFENLWLWCLTWTFNPASLHHRTLIRHRVDLWISTATLIERFGSVAPPGDAKYIAARR